MNEKGQNISQALYDDKGNRTDKLTDGQETANYDQFLTLRNGTLIILRRFVPTATSLAACNLRPMTGRKGAPRSPTDVLTEQLGRKPTKKEIEMSVEDGTRVVAKREILVAPTDWCDGDMRRRDVALH